MNMYEKATLDAIKILINMSETKKLTEQIIIDEWEKAVRQYTKKETCITKSCPRVTFLELCFSGKIKDLRINPKKLENKNAYYGITMLETLQKNLIPDLVNNKKAFWQYHIENYGFPEPRNNQDTVVKALFNGGYFI